MVNQLYPNNLQQNNRANALNNNSTNAFRSANGINASLNNISLKDPLPDINITQLREHAKNELPLARNIEEKKENPLRTMMLLVSGLLLGPVFSKIFQNISSPDGFLVRTAESISKHTKFFDNSALVKWFQKAKDNLLQKPNFKTYADGLSKASLYNAAKEEAHNLGGIINDPLNKAKKILKAAEKQQSLKNSVAVLEKAEKMGLLGKWFVKAGVILKNNTSGFMKYIQGVMAAMTINNVIQAKKGEKTSTFMQELLGNWIGNIYGFKFVQKYIVSGFGAFIKAAEQLPKDTKIIGLLPKVGKALSFIPGPLRALFGFALPLAGSFFFSWSLQKLSHKVFGKPSSEAPSKNQDNPKVNDDNSKQSADSQELSSWLDKTGWSKQNSTNTGRPAPRKSPITHKPTLASSKISGDKIQHNQVSPKPAAAKTSKKDQDPDYYMPSPELLPKIVEKYTGIQTQNIDKYEQEMAGITEDLEKIGIHL